MDIVTSGLACIATDIVSSLFSRSGRFSNDVVFQIVDRPPVSASSGATSDGQQGKQPRSFRARLATVVVGSAALFLTGYSLVQATLHWRETQICDERLQPCGSDWRIP